MKSTYQILSSHLDGRSPARNVQVRVWSPDDDHLYCMDAKLNLLDFPHCRRVLLGSHLLTDNLSMIARQMDLLDTIEELIIKIDYCSPMLAINRLFLKRIYQAIAQLQRCHPKVIYTIAVQGGEFDSIKAMCMQIQSV